jgi:hypothetical protein
MSVQTSVDSGCPLRGQRYGPYPKSVSLDNWTLSAVRHRQGPGDAFELDLMVVRDTERRGCKH